jgi:lysozyme family protein
MDRRETDNPTSIAAASLVEGTSAGGLATAVAIAAGVAPLQATGIGAAVTLGGMLWKAIRKVRKARVNRKRAKKAGL